MQVDAVTIAMLGSINSAFMIPVAPEYSTSIWAILPSTSPSWLVQMNPRDSTWVTLIVLFSTDISIWKNVPSAIQFPLHCWADSSWAKADTLFVKKLVNKNTQAVRLYKT